MEIYGSKVPPEYDLSKITAHIHISYATNDNIAPAEVSNFWCLKKQNEILILKKKCIQ